MDGGENLKIIDLHSDIFTDIAFRRERGERNVFETIHLPKLRKGGVSGIIGVFWVEPIFKRNKLNRFNTLVQHALADVKGSDKIEIVTNLTSIQNAYQNDKFFIYLGIEGLTFIEEWEGATNKEKISNAFDELNQKSIRHSIFAWNETNFIAGGTGDYQSKHLGLSEDGIAAVKEHEKHRWIIDVSHLNDHSFLDVARLTDMPLLASHIMQDTFVTTKGI